MVVDRNREDLLGQVLADDILVEDLPDLVRRRQLALVRPRRIGGGALLANDIVAELDALVADEHRRTGDKLPHLVLALAAEGAVKQFVARCLIGHSFRLGGPFPASFAALRRRPARLSHARLQPARTHFTGLKPASARLCRSNRTPAPARR